MAEFCEVMKQRGRMCDSYKGKCGECGLNILKNGKGMCCNDFFEHYPQKAEKIIMDWAKGHPVMTNADKFREVFGIEIRYNITKCNLFRCKSVDCDCKECEYHGFWEKEYVEPKKEN